MGPISSVFGERLPALMDQPSYDFQSFSTPMLNSNQQPDPCLESPALHRIRALVALTPGARQIHPDRLGRLHLSRCRPGHPWLCPGFLLPKTTVPAISGPLRHRRRYQPSPNLYDTDDSPGCIPSSRHRLPAPGLPAPSFSRNLPTPAVGTDGLGSLLPAPWTISLVSSTPPSLPPLPTPGSMDHLPGFIHASISPPAPDSPDSASGSSRLQLPRRSSFASVFFPSRQQPTLCFRAPASSFRFRECFMDGSIDSIDFICQDHL